MPNATQPRPGLPALLGRALTWIEVTFCRLTRIQFSAPWDSQQRMC